MQIYWHIKLGEFTVQVMTTRMCIWVVRNSQALLIDGRMCGKKSQDIELATDEPFAKHWLFTPRSEKNCETVAGLFS